MRFRHPFVSSITAAAIYAWLVVFFAGVSRADETPAELTPNGTVVDQQGHPIAGAQITLHRWDGVMSPAIQKVVTNASGSFEFPTRPGDAYYAVVIRKSPFATIIQTVNSEGPTPVTLHPAVDAWIEVRNDAGEPLQGARIANLSVRTQENRETYLWRGMEHLLGFEFTPSDNAGRLKLPPLPKGALIDVQIDHPRRAQAKPTNLRAAPGRLGEATLPAGVMTTFQFVTDSRTPMTLDGLTCEFIMLPQPPLPAARFVRVPMTVVGDRIEFYAHPGTYKHPRLKTPDVAITPILDRLTIPPQTHQTVRFLVRKTVGVSGRVVRRDGTPHEGVEIYGQIENLSPDGPISSRGQWAYFGNAITDVEGKFTIGLPPGRGRVWARTEGYVTDRDYAELNVDLDGPNVVPNFVTEELRPIRGRVLNEQGRAVAGAVVRIRWGPLLSMQPVVSDTDGRFEIALTHIPRDSETERRQYELDVAAFVADQPLSGVTRINLRDSESLQRIDIVLRHESSPDELLEMDDNLWSLARKRKYLAEKPEKSPAGDRGQPAPDLDGAAWFNTDARSLKDCRGRYVLLDFWFTGCVPCHGDFPSVKLVHDHFEKHGVTVIGVHDNSSTAEAVREHCRQHGLTFPIVVDHPDGRILDAYRKLGVEGFPCYILIGPDGRIIENDRVTDGPFLRLFKLELVRKFVLDGRG